MRQPSLGDIFLAFGGGVAVIASLDLLLLGSRAGWMGEEWGSRPLTRQVQTSRKKAPPHLMGQRVDDGVHGRVEHGQHDEPLGLEQIAHSFTLQATSTRKRMKSGDQQAMNTPPRSPRSAAGPWTA